MSTRLLALLGFGLLLQLARLIGRLPLLRLERVDRLLLLGDLVLEIGDFLLGGGDGGDGVSVFAEPDRLIRRR